MNWALIILYAIGFLPTLLVTYVLFNLKETTASGTALAIGFSLVWPIPVVWILFHIIISLIWIKR